MSSPKIIPVDSEAHAYEISSYPVKNKKSCDLRWYLAQKCQKRAKKRQKRSILNIECK